jgi:hypothetical protein
VNFIAYVAEILVTRGVDHASLPIYKAAKHMVSAVFYINLNVCYVSRGLNNYTVNLVSVFSLNRYNTIKYTGSDQTLELLQYHQERARLYMI